MPREEADIVAALEGMPAKTKAGASIEDEEADAGPVEGDRIALPAAKAPEANGHEGVSFQSMIGAKPAATAPAAKPPPAKPAPPPSPERKNGVNVELAAWGRGEKDYAFHELRTSIENRLGVAVTDAHAALEALIDKGVVAFKHARADLLPPPVEVEDQVDA